MLLQANTLKKPVLRKFQTPFLSPESKKRKEKQKTPHSKQLKVPCEKSRLLPRTQHIRLSSKPHIRPGASGSPTGLPPALLRGHRGGRHKRIQIFDRGQHVPILVLGIAVGSCVEEGVLAPAFSISLSFTFAQMGRKRGRALGVPFRRGEYARYQAGGDVVGAVGFLRSGKDLVELGGRRRGRILFVGVRRGLGVSVPPFELLLLGCAPPALRGVVALLGAVVTAFPLCHRGCAVACLWWDVVSPGFEGVPPPLAPDLPAGVVELGLACFVGFARFFR